jgi:hypothetical protein
MSKAEIINEEPNLVRVSNNLKEDRFLEDQQK